MSRVIVLPVTGSSGNIFVSFVLRFGFEAIFCAIGFSGVVDPTLVSLGIGAPGESPDSYTFATDLNTPLRFERIALLLSQRGHSDARIEKILGGNFARLFRDVIV